MNQIIALIRKKHLVTDALIPSLYCFRMQIIFHADMKQNCVHYVIGQLIDRESVLQAQ